MFQDYQELQSVLDTAELLFQDKDWPDLYNEEQLAKNTVPVYAASFFDDLFVDFDFAQETASKIRNCKVFITNRMYHNAVRSKTTEVVGELFALRDDMMD